MKVTMISFPHMDEADLCGEAAAVCTGSKNPYKALLAAMRSGHESVLEHAVFTFRIEGVSRALLAQITRHRLASFSVKSQRYVNMEDMVVAIPESIAEDRDLLDEYLEIMDGIRSFYRRAVDFGIPKEDARYATPQAALTDMVVTMNARELRHFFSLRCCNKAQWEIRKLAERMLELCREQAPALFDDAGAPCEHGRCPEERPCGRPKGRGTENEDPFRR